MAWADLDESGEALALALTLQRKAADHGFDWPELAPLWDKLAEEIGELQEAVHAGDREGIAGELGDLLFMLVNLARHLDCAPDQALMRTNHKFAQRMRYVESALAESGLTLDQASMAQMEALWQQAKTAAAE